MKQNLIDAIAEKQEKIAQCNKLLDLLRDPRLIPLSETVYFNVAGRALWLTVNNREDLTILLSLGTKPWTKKTSGNRILYCNEIDTVWVEISACDAALPPTCRVVKEEVQIPAAYAAAHKHVLKKCADIMRKHLPTLP